MADKLTDEEGAFWDKYDFSLPKDGEDLKVYVFDMQVAYSFDGYQPPPSREAILAEVARRQESSQASRCCSDVPDRATPTETGPPRARRNRWPTS